MGEAADGSVVDESTRTTGRMSARKAQVEVITRGERRRAWTPEQKREIVSESLGPGQSATEVARKHGISTGQLYTWRQQLLSGSTAVITRVEPRFAQVEVAPVAQAMAPEAAAPEPERTMPVPQRCRPDGLIEIVLPGGALVRVDAEVDGRALRRVLGALQGR